MSYFAYIFGGLSDVLLVFLLFSVKNVVKFVRKSRLTRQRRRALAGEPAFDRAALERVAVRCHDRILHSPVRDWTFKRRGNAWHLGLVHLRHVCLEGRHLLVPADAGAQLVEADGLPDNIISWPPKL